MQALIDLTILRSNHIQASHSTQQPSPNRFAISRSSSPVATLLLPRPAYRLGDSITLVLDFSSALIPTYAVNLSLESFETVDAALALRSATSIARVTRKVHARSEEQTLFARRIVWSATVPASATPSFVTTGRGGGDGGGIVGGVSGGWGLRVGFVTKRVATSRPVRDESGESTPTREASSVQIVPSGMDMLGMEAELLEVVERTERETVMLARREVEVDSFEVVVPVRVYGAVVGVDHGGAGDEAGKKRRRRRGSSNGEGKDGLMV
jgi:hypothetical protein